MTFETNRLRVKKSKEEDIPLIMKMEEDILNRNFIWQGTYEDHLAEINSTNNLLLSIVKKSTDEFIGFALIGLDHKSNVFELRRIAIEPKGQGFGREFMEGVLKYCFRDMNMNRFWLDVYTDNEVGIRLYKSLGLIYEGTLRNSYKSDKGYKDQMVFSMLKKEYEEGYSD